jgi:hypothetical protein
MNPDYTTSRGSSVAIDSFRGAAGLLTLALRRNRARVRHWLWLAASCNLFRF